MMAEKQQAVVVVDTETTGVDVKKDGIIQLAAVAVVIDGAKAKAVTLMSTYCNPRMVIPIEAQEIHGITQEMLTWAPPPKWALRSLSLLLAEMEQEYDIVLCGHNSERFDIPLMDNTYPEGDFARYPHIDTYTLALRMFPDAFLRDDVMKAANGQTPQDYKPHKLERIYEWYLGLQAVKAHDAAADCHMAAHVLARMLHERGMTPRQAAEWSAQTEIFSIMPYGKHGGRPMKEVPKGYIQFAQRTWTDTHKDIAATIAACA